MELRLQKPAFWARLRLGGSDLRSWALGRELALGTTCDQLPQGEVPGRAGRPAGQGRAAQLAASLRPRACADGLLVQRLTQQRLPGAGEPAPEEAQSAFALQGGHLEPLACSSVEALPPPPLEASESAMQPHLWMWVDPNLVCPVPGRTSKEVLLPPLLGSLPAAGPEDPCSASTCLWEDRLPLPSEEAEKVMQREDASQPHSSPAPPQAEGTCRPVPGEARPRRGKGSRCRGRKPRRAQGGWPRPPLNYCVLISLALSSSVDSSLTVQEIYQFTRQHFPFFRTAPEGWKNTVRHNLCFSSSFEKTTNFVCLEGNRKSRLWRLTMEGQRKFQEEAQALPEDTMGLVHESMERPELMRSLFGL
ncbi:forkhead box protein R1 [Tiliqua scincoides]|uniref:forkhead box protein R1 n=1 Tax=Tiliqua scincoides TaxID=71010 RepID=UPI00346269D7